MTTGICPRCGKPYSAGRKGTGIYCACALANAREKLAASRGWDVRRLLRDMPLEKRPPVVRALIERGQSLNAEALMRELEQRQ